VAKAKIHVGIGGWTYEPWRGTFYPQGLKHADELEYAASKLTAIEINGTYYRTQSRSSFEKWREAVPDGFVFTLKASRFCTNRRVLAEAGESIAKFLGQGLTELARLRESGVEQLVAAIPPPRIPRGFARCSQDCVLNISRQRENRQKILTVPESALQDVLDIVIVVCGDLVVRHDEDVAVVSSTLECEVAKRRGDVLDANQVHCASSVKTRAHVPKHR